MSGTLALAASLAAMDRAELERLVALRPPQAVSGVQDPIGLAVELLRPDSIAAAVEQLSRSSIVALLLAADPADLGAADGPDPATASRGAWGADADADAGADATAELLRLGLLGLDGGSPAALPEVTSAVRSALDAAGVPRSALRENPGAAPAADADAGSERPAGADWYGPALTATQRAAAILRSLAQQPGRINRRGTVAVATARHLAEAARIDAETAVRTLDTLALAGLTAPAGTVDRTGGDQLVVTADAARWLSLPHDERWCELARARAGSLSEPLRVAVSASHGDLGRAVGEILPHEFPLMPAAALRAAEEFARAAEDLGMAMQGRFTPPTELLLAGDDEAARRAAARDIPQPVPGVYLQPDLSIVVPGPLAPADEQELFAVAEVEQLGVASTLRVTEPALSRAIDAGGTVAGIRALLTRLSLTGIPQPLDYLLDDLSQRVGSIVVHEHHGDEGRTRVVVARRELLDALLVDRALQHLQLVPDPARSAPIAYSRLSPEHVLTALADARYPAGTPDPAGPREPAAIRDPAGPRDPAAAMRPTDALDGANASEAPGSADAPALPPPLADLVARVHRAARTEPGAGEFSRRLELAIRDRSPVLVTAAARGQERTFTLLPVSLSGGRLRATDQSAGVERTLPVAAITAVDPA
ncbi:helicase-associated domain-containing protein [Leucobacter sp. CSA1]|uniref:Helicase-associated domain-containing protein n=1 Tax=Leucobacter chromiisoli TaxID=2796471 RepID=A0A934UTI4_9MICO|nr:helicase-associated domain-containing protein [Leucobacter chromiisoli]MBK0417740.1 helicase-associated domain-containing protein [Leucobacter chromiisoli]